jgi:hypothetical protein
MGHEGDRRKSEQDYVRSGTGQEQGDCDLLRLRQVHPQPQRRGVGRQNRYTNVYRYPGEFCLEGRKIPTEKANGESFKARRFASSKRRKP